jgi:hypothetical protein
MIPGLNLLAEIAEATRKIADIARDLGAAPAPSRRTKAGRIRSDEIGVAIDQIWAARPPDRKAYRYAATLDAETATAKLSIQLGWAPWPHWARVSCPATEAEIAAAIDAAIDAATAELNRLRLTP